MKRFLAILIGLLCLCSVNAQLLPCPISGRVVSSYSLPDLTIELTNLRTNEMLITNTVAGTWIIEWNDAPSKYNIGDKIQIVIKECETYDICKKEVAITGDPIYIEMIVTEAGGMYISCPTTTTTPVVTTIPCPDCICPECPTCPDCPVCEECPVCPDSTWEFIGMAIIMLITGMGIYRYGFGYKVYTKESGEVIEQHKHHGITNFHSPNQIHTNLKIRHPKGMKAPKYAKDEDGKWYYVGE